MISEQVWIALIAALAGIGTTYLTVRYKGIIVGRKDAAKPKDRMEGIFDGYEGLIKQQQVDIERKATLIDHLQEVVDKQREEIRNSQNLINSLREELEDSKVRTGELQDQLNNMKADYKEKKATL
jgi:chromosome segregation ATPase